MSGLASFFVVGADPKLIDLSPVRERFTLGIFKIREIERDRLLVGLPGNLAVTDKNGFFPTIISPFVFNHHEGYTVRLGQGERNQQRCPVRATPFRIGYFASPMLKVSIGTEAIPIMPTAREIINKCRGLIRSHYSGGFEFRSRRAA